MDIAETIITIYNGKIYELLIFNQMEQYVDDFSKMALALTSAQLAKDTAISDHGIGEDVATHFLGWSPRYLMLIFQMKNDISRLSHDERFSKCKDLCETMRKYWAVSSITMVSEGYCSLDAEKTNGIELSSAFLDSEMPVLECLTISHTSIYDDNSVTPVSMVAAPYSIGLGKKVNWHELLFYPEKADKHIRQARYPTMLRRSLMETPVDASETRLNRIRDEMDEMGFMVQDFTTE